MKKLLQSFGLLAALSLFIAADVNSCMTTYDTFTVYPSVCQTDSFVAKPKFFMGETVDSKFKKYACTIIAPTKINKNNPANSLIVQLTGKRVLYSKKAIKDAYALGESVGANVDTFSPEAPLDIYAVYCLPDMKQDTTRWIGTAEICRQKIDHWIADSIVIASDTHPMISNAKDSHIKLNMLFLAPKAKKIKGNTHYKGTVKGWFELPVARMKKGTAVTVIEKIPVKFDNANVVPSTVQHGLPSNLISCTAPALKKKVDRNGQLLWLVIDNGIGLESIQVYAIGELEPHP